jgi:hypothetical protein
MDLEDLKQTWKNSEGQSDQEKLNSESINDMMDRGYNSNLTKIILPEIIGIVVCVIGACWIGMHYNLLVTAFYRFIGILAIILLVLLSCISIKSIIQINGTKDLNRPYVETLGMISCRTKRFQRLQKANLLLSYLLMVMVIFLIPQLFAGGHNTFSEYFKIYAFPIGFLFLLFYSKWIYRYYRSKLLQNEKLLREFHEEE